MATFTRRTVLANPARPRRRKFSPAQIAAGFGGKRRKSTARATRSKRSTARKTTATATVKRRAPRHNATARRTRKRTARRNPGEIITLALNPAPAARKKGTMAKRKRSTTRRRRTTARRRAPRKNPAAATHRRRTRRRRHPVMAAATRRRRRSVRSNPVRSRSRRRARRNPSIPGGGKMSSLLTQGLFVIGGAVGSKLLTQAVLGSANTNWMGYGGNIAASFVLGAGVRMFLKNQQAANMVILGGVVQTLLRLLIDKTPFGARVSSLGMGDYMAQNYLTPQRVVDGLNSAQLAPPVMPMSAPSKGMGVYGGRLY